MLVTNRRGGTKLSHLALTETGEAIAEELLGAGNPEPRLTVDPDAVRVIPELMETTADE